MVVDPRAFPRTAAYLSGLGPDLGAHAACESKSVFFADLLASFPSLLEHPGISAPLRAELARPWSSQEWMPSVLVVTVLTMVRDVAHESDDAFLEWNFARQLRLYRNPLFRALIFLLSPTLLFMGSARRWHNFHRGSDLVVHGDKYRAELELRFPAQVYSPVFLLSLVAAFRAALHAARASGASVELVETTATRARYRAQWE
jgi:hypothetical protein